MIWVLLEGSIKGKSKLLDTSYQVTTINQLNIHQKSTCFEVSNLFFTFTKNIQSKSCPKF